MQLVLACGGLRQWHSAKGIREWAFPVGGDWAGTHRGAGGAGWSTASLSQVSPALEPSTEDGKEDGDALSIHSDGMDTINSAQKRQRGNEAARGVGMLVLVGEATSREVQHLEMMRGEEGG